MKLFSIVILLVLAVPLLSPAEFYKYRDADGVLRFSDTPPEGHTGLIEVYPGSAAPPQTDPGAPRPRKPAAVAPAEKPAAQSVPRQIETPFKLRKNRIILPVEVVGTRGQAKVHLVMDTGAQQTFLWRSALPAIGLRRIGRVRAAGIAGSKYASAVRAQAINVGPCSLKNVQIALMSPGRYHRDYDGLLGMDFLMKVRYEIDYARQVIIWKGTH